MELSIDQYNAYCPVEAYTDQKDDKQIDIIIGRLYQLPPESRAVLDGLETAEKIAELVQADVIPETHGKAVAIMMMLVAFGEVEIRQVPSVLQKLGLTPDQAEKTATAMSSILAPVLRDRAAAELPKMATTEMPPMTRPTETGPKPLIASPNVPQRNIIDLRKQ